MKISDEVHVTYVGGPLHGHQELISRDSASERVAITPDGGEPVIYERRNWYGEAVGGRETIYSRVTYAPRGMDEPTYNALSATIQHDPAGNEG